MILTILIKSIYAIADFALVPIAPRVQISANNNDSQSIKTAIKSDTLGTYSQNSNYLKPFDTAFIAYQMMGLNDR
jgi:hypothetical protein